MEGAPKGRVTGILRLCDSTDSKCASTGNGDICLYEKEPEDQINDLANKCVAGNGGGMIVFSSNGSPYSTWRTTSSSIPIVAVKTSIGSELTQMNLGEQVTIRCDSSFRHSPNRSGLTVNLPPHPQCRRIHGIAPDILCTYAPPSIRVRGTSMSLQHSTEA